MTSIVNLQTFEAKGGDVSDLLGRQKEEVSDLREVGDPFNPFLEVWFMSTF